AGRRGRVGRGRPPHRGDRPRSRRARAGGPGAGRRPRAFATGGGGARGALAGGRRGARVGPAPGRGGGAALTRGGRRGRRGRVVGQDQEVVVRRRPDGEATPDRRCRGLDHGGRPFEVPEAASILPEAVSVSSPTYASRRRSNSPALTPSSHRPRVHGRARAG